MNLLHELSARVRDAISKACGGDHAAGSPLLQRCQDARHGDYQCNRALALARELRAKPRDIAIRIVEKLEVSDLCEEPTIAGPGFVNLKLKDEVLGGRLAATLGDERCGCDRAQPALRFVLDYSSPNLAKDLHVGTFRTTVIGDSLARTLEFLGHTVVRQNHFGDWGTNFGTLVAVMKHEFGEGLERLEHLDLPEIEALYTRGSALRKEDPEFAKSCSAEALALQAGEESSLAAWRRLMDVTLANCREVYALLDVTLKPEDDRPESSYDADLPAVITELEEKGLLEESEGASVVFLEGYTNRDGSPLPTIVRKADGGYNYTTTDLAGMRHRVRTLAADRIIIVTDRGQSLHFEMLEALARKAGWLPPEVEFTHVGYGVIQREVDENGKKKKVRFKTREGGTVKIRDLIEEARERCAAIAREKNPDLTEEQLAESSLRLAIAGLKYSDLKQRPETDYVFDWDQMLATQGDTGVYLMYAYVRIMGIFEKGGIEAGEVEKRDTALVLETEPERALALSLARFPEIFEDFERELAPIAVCRYLFELATLFNRFHHDCPVLKAEGTLRDSRLGLCQLAARRLGLGLSLLGIQTVERM